MDTPTISQQTSASVLPVPQLDMDGGQAVVVLIKQRFRVDKRGKVEPIAGAKIRLSDEPWEPEAPEKSSVRYPADICLRKPSTDILISGSAMAPGRAPQKSLDVSVKVGPVQAQLRVFGLRVWYKGITGLSLSDPRPFEEVPLLWENAYGGFDATGKEPLEEPRNPVGRGVARDPVVLINTPAPSIEDPGDLIRGPKSRPAPAGVGPLGRHWMPRRKYVGTMDARWKRDRLPLLPVDFDDRHNQLAPPGLIAPEPFKGGELVELVNLCPDGELRFRLPKISFHVGALTDKGVVEHRPMLDTVFLEPNTRELELTWRSTIPWPRDKKRLQSLRVAQKTVRR